MPRTNTTIQAFSAAMSYKTRTEPHLINKYRIRRIHILSRVKMTIKLNRSIHPRKGHCLQSNHLIKTLEICNTTKKMLNLQVFFKIFQCFRTNRTQKAHQIHGIKSFKCNKIKKHSDEIVFLFYFVSLLSLIVNHILEMFYSG